MTRKSGYRYYRKQNRFEKVIRHYKLFCKVTGQNYKKAETAGYFRRQRYAGLHSFPHILVIIWFNSFPELMIESRMHSERKYFLLQRPVIKATDTAVDYTATTGTTSSVYDRTFTSNKVFGYKLYFWDPLQQLHRQKPWRIAEKKK